MKLEPSTFEWIYQLGTKGKGIEKEELISKLVSDIFLTQKLMALFPNWTDEDLSCWTSLDLTLINKIREWVPQTIEPVHEVQEKKSLLHRLSRAFF